MLCRRVLFLKLTKSLKFIKTLHYIKLTCTFTRATYFVLNINILQLFFNNTFVTAIYERNTDLEEPLCGLVVRVLGYRSGGPGSIPGTTRKKK
jgi:hypothetical protein